MFRPVLLLLFSLLFLPGCALWPWKGKESEFCDYRDIFAVGEVLANDGTTVTFLFNVDKTFEYPLADLNPNFSYPVGSSFKMRERRLREGNCRPLVVQVFGEAQKP